MLVILMVALLLLLLLLLLPVLVVLRRLGLGRWYHFLDRDLAVPTWGVGGGRWWSLLLVDC